MAAAILLLFDVALRRIDFALVFGWRRPPADWFSKR